MRSAFAAPRLRRDSLRLVGACLAEARPGRAKAGGQGRNRTSDTRIFSAVLYQLSYLAPVCVERRPYRSLSIPTAPREPLAGGRVVCSSTAVGFPISAVGRTFQKY